MRHTRIIYTFPPKYLTFFIYWFICELTLLIGVPGFKILETGKGTQPEYAIPQGAREIIQSVHACLQIFAIYREMKPSHD